jgi:hypothetical protein
MVDVMLKFALAVIGMTSACPTQAQARERADSDLLNAGRFLLLTRLLVSWPRLAVLSQRAVRSPVNPM